MATGTENVLDEPDKPLRIIYGDSRDEGGPTSGYVLRLCHSSTYAAQRPSSAADLPQQSGGRPVD